MRQLSEHLRTVNPYVRSFLQMSELYHADTTVDIHMYITVDQRSDQRRYNTPQVSDVAAIFVTADGVPPGDRNMITFSRTHQVSEVSVLNSALDPLAYPILFPNGEPGWYMNIMQSNNTGRKVTMLQYFCYRLAIRPDTFSLLHRCQKLFLQWVVDAYVRIEGTRLQFLRNNQSSLRTDLYHNLTDFLYQHNNPNIHTRLLESDVKLFYHLHSSVLLETCIKII